MLTDVSQDFIRFKKDENSWSPLQVLCYLVDEEREDFKARIKYLRNNPEWAPPPIDPEGWVMKRSYDTRCNMHRNHIKFI